MKYEGLMTNRELLEAAKDTGLHPSVMILLGRFVTEIESLEQQVAQLRQSLSSTKALAQQNRRYTGGSPYVPSKALIEAKKKNEQG